MDKLAYNGFNNMQLVKIMYIIRVPYSLKNTPPSNISSQSPLKQEMYCRGIYYLYEYSIMSPSLVLKSESYCKRGGGGGGVSTVNAAYTCLTSIMLLLTSMLPESTPLGARPGPLAVMVRVPVEGFREKILATCDGSTVHFGEKIVSIHKSYVHSTNTVLCCWL